MKKHSAYSVALLSLTLFACNPAGPKETQAEPLAPETRELVKQNLQNGVIPGPQSVKDNTVATAEDACQKFIAKKLPEDWFREKMQVPEDPAEPTGRKINIFYYGKIYPNSTPTLFLNGGPGADSHGSYRGLYYEKMTFDPKNKISFVFIDQRGNGCSDFYPQGNSEETLKRLAHYGSDGIVSDSEYVRKKLLGDKKWNIFGQSYGGHIVHRYIIDAPQSVKAGFSHANIVQSSGFERTKNRIASQARVMKLYLERFPEDRANLLTLKSYMTIDRCFVSPYDKNQRACGHELLGSMNYLLGFSEEWIRLHQWIGIMVKNAEVSEAEVGRYLSTFYFSEDDSNPLNAKNTANSVIAWVDRNVEGMSGYNCQKIRNELLTEGIDLNDAYIHECMEALQSNAAPITTPPEVSPTMKKIMQLPRKLMTLEQMRTTLVQSPGTRLFLYSGQRDTFVPVENFKEELALLKDLPNLVYTNFNGTGHDGYSSEPKVWAELIRQSAENP